MYVVRVQVSACACGESTGECACGESAVRVRVHVVRVQVSVRRESEGECTCGESEGVCVDSE